jgi:hypothetical protein
MNQNAPDELHAVVRAREQQHGDAEEIRRGNLIVVRRVRLEHELVRPDRDGPDEDDVELLVVRVRLCGSHVRQLPLEVFLQGLEALVLDLELQRREEERGVVLRGCSDASAAGRARGGDDGQKGRSEDAVFKI